MSGKLDQSLDEIMKDRKPAANVNRRPARKVAVKTKPKVATHNGTVATGGIRKKDTTKAVSKLSKAVAASAGSKIAISNLPPDCKDHMIKEFFEQTVGRVKEVVSNYGPDGRFRGSAIVRFAKPTAAAEATRFDGEPVDGRVWRVEVLVDAKSVAKPAPVKSLAERMVKPKNEIKNKTKATTKVETNGETNGTAKGRRTRNKKSGRTGKPKAKTADELDAEMKDYFGGGQTNGTTTAAGGDTMDDVE